MSALLERQAAMLYRRITQKYGDFYYNMSIARRDRMRRVKDRAYSRWVRRSHSSNMPGRGGSAPACVQASLNGAGVNHG